MKRLVIAAVLLTALLATAIVLKLRAQEAALAAPSGGSGVIEGTALDLGAALAARVERVTVKKGQSVKAGELLVELDCDDVEAAIAEAEARLDSAGAQRASAEAATIAAKRATGVAWAQAAAARTQGEVYEKRQASAVRNVERLVKVGEGVTAANLDQSQTEATALELQRKAAAASAQASAAQAGVSVAQNNVAEASAAAARAQVRAAEASLKRAELLRRECEIHAPRAGIIEEVYVDPGELAARGSVLVRLVDLDEVTITFYLPNAELGAGAVGAPATVIVDAYPGVSFSGTVRTISTEAAFTPRNIQTRTDRDRLVFPVEIALANPDHRLRPGMPAEVRLEGR